MHELDERRIWQRVRGEEAESKTDWLRRELSRQAALAERYRSWSRRGGKFQRLYERKRSQIACLRGMLRLGTGQPAAMPRVEPPAPELPGCWCWERQFWAELRTRTEDPGAAALLEQQQVQCRELLAILGEY